MPIKSSVLKICIMIYVWKDIKKKWEDYDMRYVDKICKFFLLLVLFSFNLSAQTVTTPSGYPVIDLTALKPLGAVLSSTEASARRNQMNQQEPSNTTFLGDDSSFSGHNGTWNAKMSIKFQVMLTNRTVETVDWMTAYNLCKSYSGESGDAKQWRLPTQRELSMIWILHPLLIEKTGFTAFNASTYWSSSEDTVALVWVVNFGSGIVVNYDKNSTGWVRCVCDL